MTEFHAYHGQPILKEPTWTWEIPCYFYAGGMAGASAGLAYLSELSGNEVLARRAWAAAMLGIGVSPALLTSDLGRPAALSEHAPDVQGHLADERRVVDPDRERRHHGARGGERVDRPFPRAREGRAAGSRGVSVSRCAPTPRRSSQTRRSPCGTSPVDGFRSCSGRAPRSAPEPPA